MADRRPSDSNIDWLPWYEQLKMHRRLQSKHSKPDPKKRASTLKSLLEFAPVTGEAASAIHAMDANKRAADDLQSGDYWGALSNYGDMALGLLGAVPLLGMAGRAGNKMAKGIKAYHGSPHDFDKFSMDKIGTGEGAQAYGHGLYFAESEDTANAYRRKLAGSDDDVVTYDGVPVKEATDPADVGGAAREAIATNIKSGMPRKRAADEAAAYYERAAAEWRESGREAHAELNERIAAAIRDADVDKFSSRGAGRMYEVEIAADPENFLDWDKPLSEQPDAFRRLREAGVVSEKSPPHQQTGQAEARALFQMPVDKGTMERRVREAGIPGIKYLDQGSRATGEGTRNYVVFDDKLINIVKKYGIAGALGAGLITADQAQAMQAEGYE